MKTLKLDHELAQQVAVGTKTSTWRLFDEKNFSVNDKVAVIDKVDAQDSSTWLVIGEVTLDKIVQKRLEDITNDDYEGHERYDSLQHMVQVFQGYYPNQEVTPNTPIKILYFTFNQHEKPEKVLEKPAKQIQYDVKKSTKSVKLYADGGSRGNPGPSACGYVLLDEHNNVVEQKGIYLGVTTNNVAEYQGLKHALEAAVKLGVREVRVYLDSMLVVNQMQGIFKVKNRDLWPIHESVKQLVPKFASITFTHVPREMNKIADGEVNKALDEHLATRAAAIA